MRAIVRCWRRCVLLSLILAQGRNLWPRIQTWKMGTRSRAWRSRPMQQQTSSDGRTYSYRLTNSIAAMMRKAWPKSFDWEMLAFSIF